MLPFFLCGLSLLVDWFGLLLLVLFSRVWVGGGLCCLCFLLGLWVVGTWWVVLPGVCLRWFAIVGRCVCLI